MWLRLGLFVGCLAVVAVAAWVLVPWAEIRVWAAAEQRGFQNAMARALRAIQAGEPFAVISLCTATAAYGFVHALGPGHGKVLLGGAALASGATLRRLTVLTLASSLAQAGTAIVLVGALVFVARVGAGDMAQFADMWLAPLSYAAIALIGCLLIYRGVRSWANGPHITAQGRAHGHDHGHDYDHACCGHAHGPDVEDVASLSSWREAAALVASIAIRPCTGALFVLVIAARFDAFAVGCLAVLTMGLGTAALNLLVASSGVAARALAGHGARNHLGAQAVSATMHITGGLLIVALSLAMLLPFLR